MKVNKSTNLASAEALPLSATKNRVVSHWTKSTPEEGIQLIFNASEIIRGGTKGVKIETHSPSRERPCQWEMTLCLAEPSALRSSVILSATKSKNEAFLPVAHPSPTMLAFTLDRIFHQSLNTGTGVYMEDPTGASRVRCDAYRTMYIYSPKLRRDVCIHTIESESWPQCVVFDASEVAENHHQEYHFQVWLVGSIPRHADARIDLRLDHYQKLLWALRKDLSTTNVIITIKKPDASCRRDQDALLIKDPLESQSRLEPIDDIISVKNGPRDDVSGTQKPVFRAHKCILESIGFFSRMLNGHYKESQVGNDGMYRIELSSDMFDEEILDILLDYIYAKIPIAGKCGSESQGDSSLSTHRKETQSSCVHSPNVGLNLRVTATNTSRKNSSISSLQMHEDRNHHQKPLLNAGLALRHWGAFYRASIHLEDIELQTLSLQQIQTHLNPESTLEEILNWGHQFEEVKSIMLEYLVKKRKDVFGDDQRSKLRPYLWAEFDGQFETLVEITSHIARQ
ncbi:hypothetical protein BGZ76_010260 [Entomortierella beljakovae]|nr:hypothetical protein BGZ76_010260 [Entomortierella beljakovae]